MLCKMTMLYIRTFILLAFMQTAETAADLNGHFKKLHNCTTNKVLVGFTVKILNVTSQVECGSKCLQDQNCTSLNIGRMTYELWSCELNNNRIKMRCSDLTNKKNFQYFEKKFIPKTCKEMKTWDPWAESGVYFIQPLGYVEPFEVFCEMETAGGGWTLVYSYRFVDLDQGLGQARVSVWPTWNHESDTPKSTTAPLSDLEEGAMEFELWKEIGEEFLLTSSVTNWYQCAPSASNGAPGSLTGWQSGNLDCSVAKVQIPGTGCDDVAPFQIIVSFPHGPILNSMGNHMIYYEGSSEDGYPVQDPCGANVYGAEATRSPDPRGAIYIR